MTCLTLPIDFGILNNSNRCKIVAYLSENFGKSFFFFQLNFCNFGSASGFHFCSNEVDVHNTSSPITYGIAQIPSD